MVVFFLGEDVLDILNFLPSAMMVSRDETEPKVSTQDIAFTSGQ